ncbi:conserved hypothetical protein [Ixodes scapularis]|uniref:Uncharacterized protein n=1 Tax=Ixodes scapularis TaxID=6945 RepID=B7PYS0_IXOSC|nr:conserved hypothetical protein [Ixodes scapularis]|eukprot:XP_002403759.1 conserved hypothetical protein [Ixodes scapularis]
MVVPRRCHSVHACDAAAADAVQQAVHQVAAPPQQLQQQAQPPPHSWSPKGGAPSPDGPQNSLGCPTPSGAEEREASPEGVPCEGPSPSEAPPPASSPSGPQGPTPVAVTSFAPGEEHSPASISSLKALNPADALPPAQGDDKELLYQSLGSSTIMVSTYGAAQYAQGYSSSPYPNSRPEHVYVKAGGGLSPPPAYGHQGAELSGGSPPPMYSSSLMYVPQTQGQAWQQGLEQGHNGYALQPAALSPGSAALVESDARGANGFAGFPTQYVRSDMPWSVYDNSSTLAVQQHAYTDSMGRILSPVFALAMRLRGSVTSVRGVLSVGTEPRVG